MKTDRTTKVLLAAIAIGLLMNALNPWLLPTPVSAQLELAPYISAIEQQLKLIEQGKCANLKIC